MLPQKLENYMNEFPKNKSDEKYHLLLKEWGKAKFNQAYIDTFLATQEDRKKVLKELGIDDLNTFYYYYLNGYEDPENMQEEFYSESLYGLEQILEDYKNPFWKRYPQIGTRYLQLSSIEGEWSYFYDKETDALYGVDWGEMDDFMAGELDPLFTSFYDFLEWYYSEEDED